MNLVFMLEEHSAKVMLEGLLPRIIPPGVYPRFIVFEGKQDLEKQLVKRLRGWRGHDTRFVVLRDQDSARCEDVKANLKQLCIDAGRGDVLIRIACRELESWYLGDLVAVEEGLKLNGLAKFQSKRKYRDPDKNIIKPAILLRDITKNEYQKVAGSRAIGPCLKTTGNTSHSFKVFINGIQNVCQNI